jgi:hypothetical protein
MIRSHSKLFQFPVYNTREAAEAAGNKVPPYTQTKAVKSWIDPNPPTADEYDEVEYTMLATDRQGRGDVALLDANGKPYLRKYRMPRSEAMTLNIPPKALDKPDAAQPLGEWNVPCRALESTEEFSLGFGGTPIIQKIGTSTPPPAGSTGGVSSAEIASLREAIETQSAKLDIVIALLRK